MKKVKNIKVKPKFALFLKIICFILCILLGTFIFYSKQISQLTNLNYSKEASRKILFSKNKDYVLSVGENKTLNAAFESEDCNEKYLDNYSKIKYVDHKDLIKNINNLLKVGYSNSDINLIITHGTNEDVIEFAKRDKVRYLEEFYTLDYAKIKNYDRYVALSDETGDNEDDIVIKVNLDLDKENYVECTQIVDFSTDMLVNKHRCLNKDFVPDDLVDISSKYTDEKDLKISRIAMNAFIKMYEAAEKEGYQLVINSAYRSYEEQEELVNTYLNSYGQSYVDKYVAKPGFSEHQTGLAFDIGSRNSRVFANSKEYEWMQENAHKYGFIYRFDKRYEDLTGFRNEAWHYRYVGNEIATYVYEHNNMSLEEYFVIFLDK